MFLNKKKKVRMGFDIKFLLYFDHNVLVFALFTASWPMLVWSSPYFKLFMLDNFIIVFIVVHTALHRLECQAIYIL
jgi:hypothetical protein